MLPTGTVTFLLTDVEGSTRSWEAAPDAMAKAIARHYELIDAAVAAHDGARPEEQGEGDSVVAAFWSASDAIGAALDLQRALAAEEWPDGRALRVRIGLHTGEARLRDDRNYTGAALHRCARLRDIGHGGQTLVSSVTAALVSDALPSGVWLVDLGAHRLRDLSRSEHVFELRRAEQTAQFAPLRSLDVLANNLPAQLTSFVGRSGELAEVKNLLAAGRLVTLTGSGGCGKTRLAVQAAAAMADGWPDGVWWVDLGPVGDPDLVAEMVASAIRVIVEPVGGPLRALQLQLRDRRLLLCLDNCEHLLDASAGLADTLLRACPDVTILATSREPLGVAGETVWRVPSLAEVEAMRLFGDRAASAQPGFTVDTTNEAAVRTVCRRLDGIPLAVELAAAWVRALAPEQIAGGLDDRFRLLAGGPRGVTARQQTLSASVDWSHDLLDEPDQAVFRRLGAFTGGFTLDAARAVCAGEPADADDMLAALGRLVDKSLVLTQSANGDTRYRLLDTLRQYASDRLRAAGETATVRDRHLDYFLAFAEAAEPELERADQDRWLDILETEHDNLRTALDWGLSAPHPERGRRLAAALPRLWLLHGRQANEGIGWLQRAIDRAPDDGSTLQARLLVGVALVAAPAGRFALILDCASRGIEIAAANGDERNRGRGLAIAAYVKGNIDFAVTKEMCAEAKQCAEVSGDEFTADLADLLEGLAWVHLDQHDEAAPLFAAVLARCRHRGDRMLGAYALAGQVYGALFAGETEHAHRLAIEAVELARPLGDYFTLGQATANLAWVLGVMGDIDGGRGLMETVVRSIEGAGPGVDVPMMAVTSGKLRLWAGDLADAIEWFERGVRYAEPMVDNLVASRSLPGLASALRRDGRTDEARQQADRSIELARKLGMAYVQAEALDQSAFLVAAKDAGRAEDLHHDALAVRVEHGLRLYYVDSLDALARLAVRAESFAEAARLLAASDAGRERMLYPRPPIDVADHEATVAEIRAALGDDFDAAWAEGTELSLDDAVAYARRARGARGRPSIGWDSLTPTELNVVNLVVEGLSNPEIATRLFVSRATVKTHLSHIFAKLDVANRTELATRASTHSRLA